MCNEIWQRKYQKDQNTLFQKIDERANFEIVIKKIVILKINYNSFHNVGICDTAIKDISKSIVLTEKTYNIKESVSNNNC